MLKRIVLAAAFVSALAVSGPSATAQSVENFYKDKTISLLIGFGVGGGNDAWSRTLAKYMGRYIPGNPSIVPKNMPGAGGLKMTNFLYNAAPKDGTVFGLTNAGIPLEPLLGGKGANFDPLKLSWIGSPDRDTVVCVARKDAPVKSLDDLSTKELVLGATGSGANTNVFPVFFANALGMKIKVIKGYKGTRDILLAAERGEVMGVCSNHDPLTRQSMYRQGKLRILFQAAIKKDKDIAAPLPTRFITNDSQRKAFSFFLARTELGRPFVAPPGVQKERIQTLRRAFDATMKDPAFIADAKKQRFNVVAMTGEELTAIIERLYKTPEDAVSLTARALGRKK